MRRVIASVVLALMIVGGCWAANHRTSSDTGADAGVVDARGEKEEAGISRGGEIEDEADDMVGASELAPPLPRAEGAHYEAFDLLRNRPLAHRTSDDERGRSVWVEAGSSDFVRYIQGNHRRDWFLDVEPEKGAGHRRGAAVRGRDGRLTMPAYSGEAEVLELSVYSPALGHNDLEARINGELVEEVELAEGWQRVEFGLESVPIGEDVGIDLEFSNLGRIEGSLSGGVIEWARLGPATVSDGIPHQLTDAQGAMTLEDGVGLSWLAWIHDDALLELEVRAASSCGPVVEVGVEDGRGGVDTIVEETIELVEGRGKRQVTTVELPVEKSQLGRIDLASNPDDGCGPVVLESARLIRPGTIAGVPEDFEAPKYVLVWLIDTLRADFLPIHFETDVKAPNLRQLADEGVSFETAYVQGTESRASHASLFTGKYPERHGVMEGGTISPNLPILPHYFRDEGYATANLVANGYVSHLLNLDRGWDHYRNFIHEETALDGQFIAERGLDWIRDRDGERFFLYLGTIDPHATYWRHNEFIELYEPEDYQGRFQRQLSGIQLEEIKAGAMQVTEREKERIINLYKNEITYNDHVFGQLRKALEEKGLWEDTLVVVTSDHGEEFWEHGSVGHGHNVHQEMVHVPLIFHYPKGLPEGRVVRSGGEVVDVLPTLLDVMGVERPDGRQGKSLLPVLFGEHGGYPAPVVATQYGLEYGLQIRHWKIYLRSGSFRVYDRSQDPGETKNVADAHPLASRWLQDSVGLFRHHRVEWDKARWGVPNNVSGEFLELTTE